MGDIVNAVADVFGFGPASKQADATTQAANISAQAAREQLALQQRMYEEGVARQQPWLQAGQNALAKLVTASDYTPFGMSQFQADPGYAFRLSEGQKALERSAAARGGLLSGATGKALQRYGQEMGSQEYQNAFNRYQTERAARLQPLQSLAGVGQTSANTLTSAAGTMGQNIAEGIGSAAAARASGYVGGANAINQAVGQGINLYGLYNQNQLYNRMYPQVPTNTYPGVDATSVMG